MAKQRKRYTVEFKRQAVELWRDSGRGVRQVAKELGITPAMLARWKEQLNGSPQGTASAEEEVKRLRKEVARLQQEREFLKKAVTFFTQNPE
jgi:transposase